VKLKGGKNLLRSYVEPNFREIPQNTFMVYIISSTNHGYLLLAINFGTQEELPKMNILIGK
jgi:hypothetical protein